MRSAILAPLAFCLAAAGALGAGWAASRVVEGAVERRARLAVDAAGLGWAGLSVDGTVATLSGAPPDAAAAERAARALEAIGRFASVKDDLSPPRRAAAASAGPAPRLVILVDERGATILGRAPGAAALDALARSLAAEAGLEPERLARSGAGPAPPQWSDMAAAAARMASALAHGRVALDSDGVSVSGIPRSDGARRDIEQASRGLAALGLDASTELGGAAPAAQARLRLEVSMGRVLDVECAAPGAIAAAVAARLAAAFSEPAPSPRCAAAATPAETEAWRAAALAMIDAAAEAGSAVAALEDGRLRFAPGPRGATPRWRAAAEALAAATPGAIALAPALGDSPPAQADAGPSQPLWLSATRRDGAAELSGTVPDEPTRSAVASYAVAVFGAERVSDELHVADEPAPPGWRAAALAAIDALAALESGEATVRDGALEVEGVALRAAAAGAAHRALAAVEGWTARSRVVVDLPARVAATRLPPARCAEKLSEIAARSPIRFAPGEAEIEIESATALDALADVLRRCGGPIEVGGHTDSQGSEGYNRRLSQARAEAVRAALVARGAPAEALAARGYGESAPVADNDSEEGRARNRRIAFTPAGTGARAQPGAESGATESEEQ